MSTLTLEATQGRIIGDKSGHFLEGGAIGAHGKIYNINVISHHELLYGPQFPKHRGCRVLETP